MTIALGAATLGSAASAAEDAPAPAGVVKPLDPATNRATKARVDLGRKLFGDARLSADGKVSCATCHLAPLAFTDGKPLAVGISGKPLSRNAPTLLNVGHLKNLFWDGRTPTLEEQARQPIVHPDEMGRRDADDACDAVAALPEYPPLFEKAFGDTTITMQRIARALAAFERTLLAGDAPFDRWWKGDEDAMSEAAVRGYRLFIDEGNCAQCHSIRQSYALFTDDGFHNTGAGRGAGLKDVGRAKVTGRDEDIGAFRTPTLRNVELTAPYMHDGSMATLAEVVEFYVDGGRPNPHLSPLVRPLALDERQQKDLVAFLHALTSLDLPQLEACERLLAEGKPREAFALYEKALEADPSDSKTLVGLANAAIAIGERRELMAAEARLRMEAGLQSPRHAQDGDPEVAEILVALGQVWTTLAPLEDAMALARQDDALAMWRRVKLAQPDRTDVVLMEAELLDYLGRRDEAVHALTQWTSAHPQHRGEVLEMRGRMHFRRGFRRQADGLDAPRWRADYTQSASDLEMVLADGGSLTPEGALFRAYAWHRLGDIERAHPAYMAAAAESAVAGKAVQGLRNLLASDRDRFRADLDTLERRWPDSPGILYQVGWERLQQDRLAEAETAFTRHMELVDETAGAHLYLAQVDRKRDRRESAITHYATALRLDPRFRGLTTEYERYLLDGPLDGFDDVDRLVAEYDTFLAAGPDEPRFQALARNNLAFVLRDVASSYASRGPGRVHTFPKGAPARAKELLRETLALYEAACARIPENAAELPFAERWAFAGVLNDTGIMYHYYADMKDAEKAEGYYLRAFELTGGAYMDAYFYNLQFLYAFELDGREERWLELSEIAKDAILKEDPSSSTGFAPDDFKRTAARRDYERLLSHLRR